MEYTVQKLARIAGVSPRTLRYYDEIGLLRPARASQSGYRLYGPAEVDRLQQILLHRQLGLELSDIARALDDPGFDRLAALENTRRALVERRTHLNALIANVERSIKAHQGGYIMTDTEKFEGMKKQLIEDNEHQYGTEIRANYGDEAIDASQKRFAGLSQADYHAMQALATRILDALAAAVRNGCDPCGSTGEELTRMHRRWLGYTWGQYSVQAHVGLAQMYIADSRFTQYYDAATPGCAQFLCSAIEHWAPKLRE